MTRGCLTFALLFLPVALAAAAPPDGKPNVLILYVDDLGYADLGVTGGRDVPTPHIDSLARNGVRCTTSYVSGCVCSPSRAGLMTGRYQQRFGFDANAEGMRKDGEKTRALDLSQATFADRPLFWRFGVQYAVRQGTWKLVKADIDMLPALYDLAADPGEKRDLAKDNPGKAAELQALWDAWNAANEPPRWIDNRWNGIEHKKANKQGRPAKKAAAS